MEEVLPEGEFAVLKPVKPVKLHRGKPQFNEQLFASFVTCADKQSEQKVKYIWFISFFLSTSSRQS